MKTVDFALDSKSGGTSEYTIVVTAGLIGSNDDAHVKCPVVCASFGGEWNGQWNTIVEGKLSVCGCKFSF
jgi:hypothetical protein